MRWFLRLAGVVLVFGLWACQKAAPTATVTSAASTLTLAPTTPTALALPVSPTSGGYPVPPSATAMPLPYPPGTNRPTPSVTPIYSPIPPTPAPTPLQSGAQVANTGCTVAVQVPAFATSAAAAPIAVTSSLGPSPSGMTNLMVLRDGQFEVTAFPILMSQLWDYNATTGSLLYSTGPNDFNAFGDLWVYHLPTGQGAQLAEGPITGAKWSPNGLALAVLCSNDLVVVRPNAPPQRVAAELLWPSLGQQGFGWSPDSARLAYFGRKGGSFRLLFVLALADGTVDTLVDIGLNVGFSSAPVWSQDGQYILYRNQSAPPPHLEIVPVDGSEPWRPALPDVVSVYRPPDLLDQLLWSADSRILIGDTALGMTPRVWLFKLSADLRRVTDYGPVQWGYLVRGWAVPGLSAVLEVWGQGPSLEVFDLNQLAVAPTPTIGPSATAGPTQPLPTLAANAPAVDLWRFPSVTTAGGHTIDATLEFSTAQWALAEPADISMVGMAGLSPVGPTLFHRSLANCLIMVAGGHSLPSDQSVETGEKPLGPITYQTYAVSSPADGLLYVRYQEKNWGWPELVVSFYEQDAACLAAAEVVLATLRPIPAAADTPTPFVPTATP